MRAMSMMRFVALGAVGFGGGMAIGSIGSYLLPFGLLFAGALGGAMLGLPSKNFARVTILALLGALGLNVGIFLAIILGALINYSLVPMGALAGAAIGASLGVAFRDWTTGLALTVAGTVGFSIGLWAGDFLEFYLYTLRDCCEVGGKIIVAGVIGGASLGAALGYLEHRELAEKLRNRVR